MTTTRNEEPRSATQRLEDEGEIAADAAPVGVSEPTPITGMSRPIPVVPRAVETAAKDDDAEPAPGAQVLSLDAFRKKP